MESLGAPEDNVLILPAHLKQLLGRPQHLLALLTVHTPLPFLLMKLLRVLRVFIS